jgi:YNFM family putative membrane transporter
MVAALAFPGIGRGSAEYWRVCAALFLGGYATFSLIYCVQPLLPVLAAEFGVSAAGSSLALSASTFSLAIAILCAAAVSEGFGRRGLMFVSMLLAAVLNLLVAAMPFWHGLLALRALEGFVLGGVPAVAMAYLAEEIAPEGLGFSMGLYVGGTALGGMLGRVGTGILAQAFSWRAALAAIGCAGIAAALGFIALLPPSRNFIPRRNFEASFHLRAWRGHLASPAMPYLFAIGFLVMGAFVTIYNYAGFRLLAPPYSLSQTGLGLIFTVYLFGVAASSLAGGLADRVGRGAVLLAGLLLAGAGVLVTMPQGLGWIVTGIIVLTIGFFITHSVASGWVGRLALGTKGHASSLYLLAYYLGSSVAGSAGGWFWRIGGWGAVAAFTLALLSLGVAAAWRVRGLTVFKNI